MTEYLDYLQTVARRSPLTIQGYRADYNRFLHFLGDQTTIPLADVSAPLVERWVASMRGLSDASLRRALNALSSLFRWAVRFGYSPTNPVDLVERPRKKRRVQPCPTAEQVSAMLQATRSLPERTALLALATSGLRRAELLGLDWATVDLPRRRLRVVATFVLVLITWVFFRAETLPGAIHYGGALFGLSGPAPAAPLLDAVIFSPQYLLVLAACVVVHLLKWDTWDIAHELKPIRLVLSGAALTCAVAVLFTQSYNPFLYFRF